MYFPVIQFKTAAGVTVTAESKTSKSRGYPIGKTIAVLYDPDHPDNMEIDAFLSRWVVVIIAISFAVILLFIGIAALFSPG